MKNRPNIIQSHPHSGATAFGDFCTQSDERGFNVSPGDISAVRLFKNGFQCFAVFAVHNKIISHIDTIYKSIHCDAQRRAHHPQASRAQRGEASRLHAGLGAHLRLYGKGLIGFSPNISQFQRKFLGYVIRC